MPLGSDYRSVSLVDTVRQSLAELVCGNGDCDARRLFNTKEFDDTGDHRLGLAGAR